MSTLNDLRWDGLVAILETLEAKASEYLEETQEVIWEHVRYFTDIGTLSDY